MENRTKQLEEEVRDLDKQCFHLIDEALSNDLRAPEVLVSFYSRARVLVNKRKDKADRLAKDLGSA